MSEIRADALQQPHHIEQFNQKYPHVRAGIHIGLGRNKNDAYQTRLADENNIWSPFSSQIDWEIARWAELRGPSSTALTELLAIQGVSDCYVGLR